jgi:DNA polymerase
MPVRGEGPCDAKVVIVGRNPGREEDRYGRPFIGRSGQKLTQWLERIGLDRENDVGIINLVKCFTPDNRSPTKPEIATCHGYLIEELKFFSEAKVLILMGAEVTSFFIKFEEAPRILSIAGKIYCNDNSRFSLIPMYHPSYVLRNPAEEPRYFEHFAPLIHDKLEQLGAL